MYWERIEHNGVEDIKNTWHFYDALSRIKGWNVSQVFLALRKYCEKQRSFVFKGILLSDIMKTILKIKIDNYSQKKEWAFLKNMCRLRDFKFYLAQDDKKYSFIDFKIVILPNDLVRIYGEFLPEINKDLRNFRFDIRKIVRIVDELYERK